MPPELEYGNIEKIGNMFWLDGGDGRVYAPNKIDFLDLAKLKEWSQTPVDHINTEYEGGGIRFDAIKYPENYMKYFYISDQSRVTSFNIGLQKDYIPFVKAYRKTLDIIAPIK